MNFLSATVEFCAITCIQKNEKKMLNNAMRAEVSDTTKAEERENDRTINKNNSNV